MANYCSNTLKVTGDVTELRHFINRVKNESGKFTLQRLSPIPKELKNLENIDDWKFEFWGTSYICDDQFYVIDETKVVINFLSTWAPPLLWVKYVAKFYDGLTFYLKYDEPGMCFKGSLKAKGMNFQESSSIYVKHSKSRYIEVFQNS